MPQVVFSSIPAASTSGTQLATILTDFKNAVMSGLIGPSRPTQTTAGGMWVDNSADPIWVFTMYDGTSDIPVFSINTSTGTASVLSSDSQFEITKITDDAVGGVLKFLKGRVAGGGQTLTGDEIGVAEFYGQDASEVERLMAEIKVVSLNDVTNTERGSYLTFSLTNQDAGAPVEMARLINGNLGVGLSTPLEKLHALGNAQLNSISDDALSAALKGYKERTAGDGSVQTSDDLFDVQYRGKDSSANNYLGAGIKAVALEGATATTRGTEIQIRTVTTGAASATTKMIVGDEISHTVHASGVSYEVSDAFYFGNPTTDGSWRIKKNGADLEIQVRDTGVWVAKDTINP